jgi:hypothetical protein
MPDSDFTGPFFAEMEQPDRNHVNPRQRIGPFEVTLWNCRKCNALVTDRSGHERWHSEFPDQLRVWIETGAALTNTEGSQ